VNNSPDVANKTRRRVLEVIEALGYQPNLVARSLKTRRSQIIEVITFGVDTYIPRELMEAIGRAAKAQGYRVMFTSIVDEDIQEVHGLLHRLNSRMCDGVILTAPIENDVFVKLIDAHPSVPIVQVRNKRGSTQPSVIIDQHLGSQMATQYLIDLGHHQIAEICAPLHWHEAAMRHESFEATLNANGLTPAAVIESLQWMPWGGYEAAQRLLDSGQPFSALVAANDYLGLGAILAFTERGLRVELSRRRYAHYGHGTPEQAIVSLGGHVFMRQNSQDAVREFRPFLDHMPQISGGLSLEEYMEPDAADRGQPSAGHRQDPVLPRLRRPLPAPALLRGRRRRAVEDRPGAARHPRRGGRPRPAQGVRHRPACQRPRRPHAPLRRRPSRHGSGVRHPKEPS
jgi:DNA-binding LacI/PurR family transcriptional regulator